MRAIMSLPGAGGCVASKKASHCWASEKTWKLLHPGRFAANGWCLYLQSAGPGWRLQSFVTPLQSHYKLAWVAPDPAAMSYHIFHD